MLSINSLAENLLPNLYVKSLDLQSRSIRFRTNTNAPKYQGAGFSSPDGPRKQEFYIESSKGASEANIVLSVKSLKTSTYSQEIIELLNSEFSDDIKIFAHQITDRFLYENILQALAAGTDLNNNNSIADLELPTEANFKSIMDVLTRKDTKKYVNGLKTQVFNFIDIPLWNKFSKKSTFTSIGIPEQLLDDGTILNEGVLNLNFKFNKDTSFLAYLFIVGLKSSGGNIGNVSITSKPTAEVILIDGKFQNTGVIFTIAQDQAGTSMNELTNFGKVGDVWAGGVHIHEGRYMAGTSHTSLPHAYLDYRFVEVAKYSDNRVIQRRTLTPFNVTKELNTVESSVNVFKNNLKLTKFAEYKKKSYVGDIMFSQDQEKNINGLFVIDKHETLKNNCAFPFMFRNIDVAFDQGGLTTAERSDITSLISANSQMLSLKVYGPYYDGAYAIDDELLKTMDQEEISATQDAGSSLAQEFGEFSSLKVKKITGIGIKPSEDEVETFIFKHHIGHKLVNSSKLKYRYVVEYKDPTINLMKSIVILIKRAKTSTQKFINYVESISGFDQYTQKLKEEVAKTIIPNNFDWVSNTGKPYYIKSVLDLANSSLAYIAFFNPDVGKVSVSKSQFSKQLRHLCRIDTTSLDKLNILNSFLDNLESTLELALSSITTKKQSKNSGASENEYDQNVTSGDVFSTGLTKTITQESKECYINITDHGYDFMGHFGGSRDKNNFYKVSLNDFKDQCHTLFSTQFSNLSGDDQFTNEQIEAALDTTYKPQGFSARSPREYIYSFLNIPIQKNKLKKCVMLPETVITKDLDIINSQHILLAVIKNKKQILQNHSKLNISAEKIITEDILSILGEEGGDQSATGIQNENPSKKISQTSNNSLLQKDVSFSTSRDLGSPLQVRIPAIASTLLKQNIFKISSRLFGTKLVDDLPNYVLLSMLYRKLFTNAANQTGFKLKMSESDFEPWTNVAELFVFAFDPPPLNVLCLSIGPTSALSTNAVTFREGSITNFSQNGKAYLKRGVVNPGMLPYFWFIHQNVAVVECLHDFETEQQTSMLKIDSDSPISENGGLITIKNRNIRKPIFRPVTNSLLNSKKIGDKLICRLRQYENATYVNKKLLDELKMPLINNYFILEIE